MKKFAAILFVFFYSCHQEAEAQVMDTLVTEKKWEGSAALNFYFKKEDIFISPVFKADKGWLHLEARYNYESEETFSVWGGYNFSGENKFEYKFTPMIGFVAGEIVGVAPGLEMTLGFRNLEFYSETEYLIAPENSEDNYFYTWFDLTWSPRDWLWAGLSGQRTRLFESDIDLQYGALLGGGYKNWELTGYWYNPGTEDTYIVTTLSWSF